MDKIASIKKGDWLYMITGAILILSLVNTFSIMGLGNQINSLQGAIVLPAANGGGANNGGTVNEAAPLGGVQPPAPAPQQPNAAEMVDDDAFLGPADAKVTVVEFSDFECPFCAAAAGTHEALIAQFKSRDPSWEAAVPKLKGLAAQGKIKFVYRDFPLGGHSFAQKAAEATECAAEQGKFWEMHDAIFENQEAIDVTSLKQYAGGLGLNQVQFDECLDSGKMAEEVRKDLSDGQRFGVNGTPAFFVNGTVISGAQPFSVFEQVIEAELAKGGA